jgi:endogenous inhibitor of DNA gyrase (YacG/DUF329 family)
MPFCSERCRLMDLGTRFDEDYYVCEELGDGTGSINYAPEDDS